VKKTTDPPRLGVWLLTKRLSAKWCDFIIGDLAEEFAMRSVDSRIAARAWFWCQAVRCLAAPPPVHRASMALERSRGDSRMHMVVADLCYALRVVSRTPSFAVAVVSVLALGIGANTALFSIVNAVLLRPLPFEEPERLVRIFTRTPAGVSFDLSPGKFYDWQRDAQSFEGMAMYPCCGFRGFALTGTGTARAVRAAAVSAGFFEIVRARPALGRVFRQEEDTPGGKYVVVLSDRFWRTEFGGNPDVIGRTVRLSDEPYTIVGIMPAHASVASWPPMACDLWVPLALSDEERANRQNHNLEGVARLKRDVELAHAQAEMDAISARLAREFPKSDGRWGAVVIPMQEAIVGNSRTMLLMLLGAVGLVLLIACANVGNLFFTRTLNRRREIAIRSALGAGRGRVFQQLLIEALLLASIGGALGLLVAHVTLDAASALLANHVPRANEISNDAHVLLFVVAVSILAGLVAGTLPALRAERSDLNAALKEGGRSNGAIGVGTRRVLIVCEVALSVVLLMGAGVMIQSLLALRHSNTGFDPNNVLSMKVTLVKARYPTSAQRSSFFDTALQRIRALPGVDSAGSIDDLPFIDGSAQPLEREGYTEGSPGGTSVVHVRQITPGYLRAMRIPLLRGRGIVQSDVDVLLVSQDAAKLVWGADDPIGRLARLPLLSKTALRQVVGVVGDVKQRDLSEPSTPTVYYYSRERSWGSATLVIRTSLPPTALAQPVVAAIHAIDPEQPVEDIRTMEQVIDSRLTSQRFSALLLGIFAGAALLLASVGIYAVLSYIVRGRTREIGIRTALGARAADVLRMVIVEGMWPTLVGIAAGTIAAMASARVMETLVFGVSASDPLTLAAVAATLAVVALMASLVPAYRALRLDPARVLRAD
jgi:putative ABC transport system permease protein